MVAAWTARLLPPSWLAERLFRLLRLSMAVLDSVDSVLSNERTNPLATKYLNISKSQRLASRPRGLNQRSPGAVAMQPRASRFLEPDVQHPGAAYCRAFYENPHPDDHSQAPCLHSGVASTPM